MIVFNSMIFLLFFCFQLLLHVQTLIPFSCEIMKISIATFSPVMPLKCEDDFLLRTFQITDI